MRKHRRDVNASLLKQLLAAETNKWQTAIGRDSQKDDEASNKSSESASESVAQNDPYTQDHDSAQAEVLHAAVEAERTFEKGLLISLNRCPRLLIPRIRS